MGENWCCSNSGRPTPREHLPRDSPSPVSRPKAGPWVPGPVAGAGFQNLSFSVMTPYLFVTFRKPENIYDPYRKFEARSSVSYKQLQRSWNYLMYTVFFLSFYFPNLAWTLCTQSQAFCSRISIWTHGWSWGSVCCFSEYFVQDALYLLSIVQSSGSFLRLGAGVHWLGQGMWRS